jgi:hypothetical protein
LKDAGTLARYQRVETIDWAFTLIRPSTSGARHWAGRQRLKRVGDAWLMREDLKSPEGLWSVWTDPDNRVEKDGVPVEDPGVRDERLRDARERMFWRLAPFSLGASAGAGRYLGSGYFHDRLARRLALPPPGKGWPVPEPVVAQLDPEGHRWLGVTYGPEEDPGSLVFDNHESRQNLLNLADWWTRYNRSGERLEVVRTESLVFNSFINAADLTAGGAEKREIHP